MVATLRTRASAPIQLVEGMGHAAVGAAPAKRATVGRRVRRTMRVSAYSVANTVIAETVYVTALTVTAASHVRHSTRAGMWTVGTPRTVRAAMGRVNALSATQGRRARQLSVCQR